MAAGEDAALRPERQHEERRRVTGPAAVRTSRHAIAFDIQSFDHRTELEFYAKILPPHGRQAVVANILESPVWSIGE